MNPLLNEFHTPFNTVPFDKIGAKHFIPGLTAAIAEGKQKIEIIKEIGPHLDFINVIESMENASCKVNLLARIFFNLYAAEKTDQMQEISKEFSVLLTEYSNDVLLDEKLFLQVKEVHDKKDKLNLTCEQNTLLTKYYRDFIRNGALLTKENKEALREIDKKISKLQLIFGDNVLAEKNAFQLIISDEDDLLGLNEAIVEAAAFRAKEKGHKNSWVFTLDYPSYLPFMKFSDKRHLREKMFRAFSSTSFKNNQYDNRQIVKELSQLRYKRAQLLGYKTHADFVLEERMAQTPERVFGFLDEIFTYAKPVALKELEELRDFAFKRDGIREIQKWDYFYYLEKLKRQKFDIDEQSLRPYFKLENVVKGIFLIANELYGMSFEEIDNIPVYHKDVKTYQVLDNQRNHLGIFYADFFPRDGKRNGAWMTNYFEQGIVDGVDRRPHVAIVCNFTRPTDSSPSLLTFDEVRTLFHEFGHSLHGLLSKCNYSGLSGVNVYWDFVELPSQIMENWLFEEEALDLFASHYQTKEVIPHEMVKKIKDSSNFNEGYSTIKQIGHSYLDLAWHSIDPSNVSDVAEHEKNATEKTRMLPLVEGSNMSTSFSHIFQGGYSSGYYSYKWAEVLDADAFEYFKEKGIFNKKVAQKFLDNILSKGGSEDPMHLYKKFRGRVPEVTPLLRRAGLIQ